MVAQRGSLVLAIRKELEHGRHRPLARGFRKPDPGTEPAAVGELDPDVRDDLHRREVAADADGHARATLTSVARMRQEEGGEPYRDRPFELRPIPVRSPTSDETSLHLTYQQGSAVNRSPPP